jgi:hypothetical protein
LSLQVWLYGSIRSFVLHVVLCGEACRQSFITSKCISWTIIYSELKCTAKQWNWKAEGILLFSFYFKESRMWHFCSKSARLEYVTSREEWATDGANWECNRSEQRGLNRNPPCNGLGNVILKKEIFKVT